MRLVSNGARAAVVGLAAGLLAGCSGHGADCLKSNGAVTTQRRAVSRRIREVAVFTNVDLIIVPDTAVYAEVRAGENVINDLEFTTPGGPQQLVITNTSSCNWVRSYDTPREVRLHLPNFHRRFNVQQRGYGLISSEGQWAQDTLFVRVQSTGDVNLNVYSTYLYTDIYDAGDITLSGYAYDFHPGLGSNGFLFASALRADYCYFFTFPSWVGDAHVRPLLGLGGTMYGRGTLYYTGSPYVAVDGPNAGRLVRE